MSGPPLLAGIHRCLKDADTPWQDRLKLARFAWCSSQCFLPNKQQVLLDWVCNALANQTKWLIPGDVADNLWQYLHDVLHSPQLQESLETSAAVTMKDAIYPVLQDALITGSNNITMATACCRIILQSSSLSRSLTASYDLMLDLLSAFLHLVPQCLETGNQFMDTAVACLQILMRKFIISHRQRQLQAPRKVFSSVYEKLLLSALHLYTSECAREQTDIKGQIEDLIGSSVFNREMCDVYTKYLTLDETDKQPLEGKDKHFGTQHSDIDNLMEFLRKEARNSEEGLSSSVLSGLPVLYSTFFAVYKPSADVMFAMCKKLCSIMGILPQSEYSGIDSGSPPDWQRTLPALEQILKIVLSNDIYVVAIDNAESKLKFQWFHQLLLVILNHADRVCASFYKCLHILLDLNHLIIEEELTLIWNVSLVHPDGVHKVDRLDESRTEFLGALMQTYTKLRQFDKLLECLLKSYRESTDASYRKVHFHPKFVHRFSECIQALPPGLTLDLWKLLIDEIINCYIDHLCESANQEPPKKKRKSKLFGKFPLGLEWAAVTFNLYLMAARLVDLSVIAVMMSRLEIMIEETCCNILQPLHNVCQETRMKMDESALFSTLLLTYSLGELQLVLLQHTNYGSHHTKYGAMMTNKIAQPAVAILKAVPCLGDFLEINSGDEVVDVLDAYTQCLGNEKQRTLYLVHLLRTQQARAVLLHTPSDDNTNLEAIMQRLSDCVFESDVKIDSEDPEITWDGQIAGISDNNYAIAYLHHITQTLSLWLPYTTPQHHHHVASLLVQVINCNTTTQCEPVKMTLGGVARAFVHSDVCMESKELQSALLGAGLTSLAKCLGSTSLKKSSNSGNSTSTAEQCGQLLAMLAQVNDDHDANWETLKTVGKEHSILLQSQGDDRQAKLKKLGRCVNHVYTILNVLQQLPLTHMLSGNQERCMLGLVILDTMLAAWLGSDSQSCHTRIIETLILCRNLEIKILQAMRSTGLLKCFGVGIMLADIVNNHSHAWKVLLTNNHLSQDEWKRNYMELNDITQKMIRQWFQKVTDRLTHEGSVLRDITGLIQKKLSTLKDQLTESCSQSVLYEGIPWLLTTFNVIQINASSHQMGQECIDRVLSKRMKRLCASLQELLSHSVFHKRDNIDPLLVSCLAKATSGLIALKKLTNPAEAKASLDRQDSSIAMEPDDAAQMETQKKFKKLSQSSKIEGSSNNSEVCKFWQSVLHPILSVVLDHLVQIQEFDHLSDTSCGLLVNGRFVKRSDCMLPACLDYMSAVLGSYDMVLEREVVDKMWNKLVNLMSVIDKDNLEARLFSTASHVLTCMDREQFKNVMENSLVKLGAARISPESVASLKACVLTWQVLPCGEISVEKQQLLEECFSKALICFQCLLVETVRDWSTGGVLTAAILKTINTMLANRKKLVDPKQAMLSLQACLTIQFTAVPDGFFPSVFCTLYMVLKTLLQAFPQTVLHCTAVYIACVQHMLRGVMQRCHQQSEGGGHIGDQELYTCAENMERLLTQIASHKKEMVTFVIVLISEYINELQKGTLFPFAKKAIVVGVYNLVDICDEKALSLLQAMLPFQLKEIYTEFYSDFKKYHKYQGKV